MERLWLVIVAGRTAVVLAPASQAAAPRIVIVSGEPLTRQIVISDWTAIFRIVEPVANAPHVKRAQLAERPRLELSMFWGPRWVDYLAAGHRAAALRPQDADQQGSFYPAWHAPLRSTCRGWASGRASCRQRLWRRLGITGFLSQSGSRSACFVASSSCVPDEAI